MHAERGETCGELTQKCFDGYTGQLALCDTDFIATTVDGHPLPFSTSVSDRAWGHFGGNFIYSLPSMLDMPCSFGRSVLRPLQRHLPFLGALIDELSARNQLLVSGAGVAQLSFSCIEAWIIAAATSYNLSTSHVR